MSDASVARELAIVERDEELTCIDGAVAAAVAGSGSVLLIEGPAGIGKSRLLAEARVRAAAAGMQIFGARGGVFERDLAYGAVRLAFERELLSLPEGEREALPAGAAALARPH